jgi:hypothetical protein
MAPEQMRTNQPLDARTDIWSLGVVAYELLTGRLPFDAQAMPELCAMILQDDPAPTRRLRHEVPGELDAVILRCLEKKADRRFPDLAAFAAALAPFGSTSAGEAALRVASALQTRRDDEGTSAPASSPALPPTVVLAPTVANALTAASWTGAQPASRAARRRTPIAWAAGVATLSALGIGAWSWLHAPAPPVTALETPATASVPPPPLPPPPPAATAPAEPSSSAVDLSAHSASPSASTPAAEPTDAGAPPSKAAAATRTRSGPTGTTKRAPAPSASPRPTEDPTERMKSRFD